MTFSDSHVAFIDFCGFIQQATKL